MSRYPVTFQKPENALKRAEELIHVDQKYAALNALHEVITSKRHRTWQKTLEKIMFKYVECVLFHSHASRSTTPVWRPALRHVAAVARGGSGGCVRAAWRCRACAVGHGARTRREDGPSTRARPRIAAPHVKDLRPGPVLPDARRTLMRDRRFEAIWHCLHIAATGIVRRGRLPP